MHTDPHPMFQALSAAAATSPPSGAFTASAGPAAPAHVLLLLADRLQIELVEELLRQRLERVQVTRAANLQEAMMTAPGPALAVLDPALCDALELEFVEHLLRTHAQTVVLLLQEPDAPSSGWPAHPRRMHTPRDGLLGTVDRLLGACAAPSLRQQPDRAAA